MTSVAIGVVVAFSALLAGFYCRTWSQIPAISIPQETITPAQTNRDISSLTGSVWMALQSRPAKQGDPGASRGAPDRYRLAGTFFIEGAGEPLRKAILDSPAKREQFIVSEGERLDDLTVEKVYYDHVTLRGPLGSQDIWVEFASRTQPVQPVVTNTPGTAASGGTNKFGCVQTQENRWKFSRKPLLDYYQELLDEPDRMVAVFDTMKPVRDQANKITGYVVGLEGEKDFFDAVGLQQGDIVRAVNSLPMTNRRRAEAFIDQFLKDQMNAVVLEVERSGKVTKQIYQMQP